MNSKWSHFYLNPGPVTHSLISGIMKAMVYILYMFWIMQNVDCTLYLALYKSSFHWKKNTKDTCIQVYSGYFYAFYATLYLVLKWFFFFFFLCKCLKLLYLIKELILCDLTKHKWHVRLVHIIIDNLFMIICQCFFFPNEPHFFFSPSTCLLCYKSSHWESQQTVLSCTQFSYFQKCCKRKLEKLQDHLMWHLRKLVHRADRNRSPTSTSLTLTWHNHDLDWSHSSNNTIHAYDTLHSGVFLRTITWI